MYRVKWEVLVVIWCCWYNLEVESNIVRNEDICGAHNGRRLYLELGERGILYAKNVSLVKNEQKQYEGTTRIYASNNSHEQCSLELVTCPSCIVTVTFKNLALSHHCNDAGIVMDSPCRCDYVWISEPPYEDVSGTPYCGLYSPITYRSNTRTLSIALLYSQSHRHAFTLEYTAERNRIHLKGIEGSSANNAGGKGINATTGGILTSPFFPARYPRDLGMEYIITCPMEASSCRVRLLFSDFQLATVSIVEFYDWNGQRLDVSSGARFRPPVIVSSGPSLLIRFYANGGTGLGYKAFYSFVLGNSYDKNLSPITDCGGYVENLGGAITMMDMVGQGLKTYDCVWLIRPPTNFLHLKTHMYLKVITFADMGGNTELTIKQGPTSALLPLEVLRYPASQLQPPRLREHVAPVTSGFHVSLRGTFGSTSRLAIAYATFSYMDCFTGSDFLCQNHRCIPSQLNCDGFDHCGDNSDEPASCFRDWEVEPADRKWHMNKANYYFPKIDRYPDLKTATLVFVASSLGLIVLISALIILLYRMGARARQQRELQSRLQTISELLDGARIDEITVSDDPPVYEAPPGYDEVVKVGMDGMEVARRRKKRNLIREPRSRSSPNQRSRELVPIDNSGAVHESLNINVSSQTNRVPESPPPPYVTPPPRRTFVSSAAVANLVQLPDPLEGGRGGGGEVQVSGDQENLSGRGRRVRRSWSQCGLQRMQSLPGEEHVEAFPRGGSSSFDAAEVLGAYFQKYMRNAHGSEIENLRPVVPPRASHENREARYSCISSEASSSLLGNVSSQRNDSEGASRLTRGDYKPDSNPAGIEDRVAITTDVGMGPTGHDEETEQHEVGGGESNQEENFVCCGCEGACGCVINGEKTNNAEEEEEDYQKKFRPCRRRRNRRQLRTPDNEQSGCSSPVVQIQQPSMITTKELRNREKGTTSDFETRKNTIIRLLRSGASFDSACRSTASEGALHVGEREDFSTDNSRKMSVCSNYSHATGVSFVISGESNEPFHDEFEIVSERASILGDENSIENTPSVTPNYFGISSYCGNLQKRHNQRRLSQTRRSSLRYSSCDMESLYESIQALDTFLARRNATANKNRNQSVTVMVFETPEQSRVPSRTSFSSIPSHFPEPDEATGFTDPFKNWRSSDDALSYYN